MQSTMSVYSRYYSRWVGLYMNPDVQNAHKNSRPRSTLASVTIVRYYWNAEIDS